MDLPDSLTEDYFHLAEKVDTKCPECRCPMTVDQENGFLVCPKRGDVSK